MSVTPDFVGQIYKDTTTGNLWRANSLAAGDWTLELQNQNLNWESHSANLGELIGLSSFADMPGITSLTHSGISSLGGFDIEGTTTLISVSAPNLQSIDPSVSNFAYFTFINNSALTTLSFPLLTQIGDQIFWTNNSSLSSIDLTSLSTVGGRIVIKTNPTLVLLAFPSLIALGGDIDVSGCGLNAASINGLLATLVSIPTYGAGKTVSMDGGTNAAPSGQGIADKATLIGRGATVTTN